ncbi:MAG TPA: L,D-transpeptidase family protein [Chitinophagaceae bacterium]|jgi:murein L,D-transpeptidase YcbB/YkuD|nr:L,D-transpeptidase family protein [Chitinophagaceae bacterium]
MKNVLPIALLCCFVAACSYNDSDRENKAGSENSKNQKKNISKRDRSINASNSYNDLFFDSTAMEQFVQKKKIADSIADRIRSFYNTRNYQYAWFSSDGLTEQARAFWNLHDYITTYDPDSSLKDKALQRKMDNLVAEDQLSVSSQDKSFLNTELTLTQHFIQYILHNYEKGFVKRKEMERFIPLKKQDVLKLADSILNKKHKDDKYFEDVNPAYSALKDQLDKYIDIAKEGGWPQISITKKRLKKGVATPGIAVIKKRLQITGDLSGDDSSSIFNDTLVNAIKNFQERHGYSPTGKITDSLVKEMNVPVVKRIEQIIMNMERMRWMATRENGNLIVVNIPEFVLHVYEGKKKAFDMDVVVGKEGHNTMMFNGDLNQVVFCPNWNVPQSIVKKEILPELEKDKNYLQKQNMEITGEEDGVPVIRQLPGEKNALGKVKFLFPNSFNIYFHDTPAKSLFEKDKRAYSHGCIRLREPEKMANYVLRDQPEWTPERIDQAMNAGKEKFVKVKDPIPVLITYYTTWVDDNGQLNFREDIYGHDSELAMKMFL